MNGSLIFDPYRVAGLVADDANCPIYCSVLGDTTCVWASVGKVFHMYFGDKLELKFISPYHEKRITAVCGATRLNFSASDSTIRIWHRMELIGRIPDAHENGIKSLMLMGEMTLVSVGMDDGLIKIWNMLDVRLRSSHWKSHQSGLVMEIEKPERILRLTKPTVNIVMHPPTYINKLLVAYKDGTMEIWNFNTSKLIYTFPGWGSEILCIAQSDVIDVMGIGLSNGQVVVHNIKTDRTIRKLSEKGGAVTAVAFRGDILAIGFRNGEIRIWDLKKKVNISTLWRAHDGAITKIYFLINNVHFLSAGSDNSLKVWRLDEEEQTGATMWFQRSGHYDPPDILRAYSGKWVISSGADRSLRICNISRNKQNFEFTQHRIISIAKKRKISERVLKLRHITDLCFSKRREKQWGNLISIHEGGFARI